VPPRGSIISNQTKPPKTAVLRLENATGHENAG
jgi:hypothetical protein